MAIDGIFPNGSISVFNACRLNTPKGQLDTIKGYADRPDEKEEGRLVVNLEGVPFSGDCKYISFCQKLTYHITVQIGWSSWDLEHSMEAIISML